MPRLKRGYTMLDVCRRLCLPREVCKKYSIEEKSQMEISIEYGNICLKKFDDKDIENRPYVSMVRSLDVLNRITIPVEYCKVLNIKPNDRFRYFISADDEKFIFIPLRD